MHEYLHIGKATELKNPHQRRLYRFFEMLVGILSWTTLLAVVACSFVIPAYTAVFIIIFDTYWLVKTLYLSLHLRYGYSETRKNMQVDWQSKLPGLPWENIYHLVILPTYQESEAIIRDSLKSLATSQYPQKRLIVVLAQEARAGQDHNKNIATNLAQEFASVFHQFIVTEHPDNVPGELAGKGANCAWAGRYVKEHVIDQEQIPYADILVSVFDIDTVVFPQYFGRLTYVFLNTPNRLRSSYQPIPLFINNIWEAPAFARIVAFSSTFWQTIQQARAENLITFSSHSMPFQAVVDINFWQSNVVSEDSRVFWQCFLRYDGDYNVVPLYYPVSMDANVASSLKNTMLSVYKQHRRWSYGVENVAYFLFGFTHNKKIAFSKKFFYTVVLIEGYWSWATNALMLFLLGWLPGLLGGPGFNRTILSFNHAFLSQTIMRLALLALVTPLVLSLVILPPRPPRYGKFQYIWMVVQWVLFPFTTIFFGSLPGMDGQTRLMLGRYMGFWVTPKHRKPIQSEPSSEVARVEPVTKDTP